MPAIDSYLRSEMADQDGGGGGGSGLRWMQEVGWEDCCVVGVVWQGTEVVGCCCAKCCEEGGDFAVRGCGLGEG